MVYVNMAMTTAENSHLATSDITQFTWCINFRIFYYEIYFEHYTYVAKVQSKIK